MSDVFVIAGPNGAGKTTAAMSLLPDILQCMEYVNADAIAKGISPFRPDDVAFEAGRLMLKRIKHLIKDRSDFAFETTLATRSFTKLIENCRNIGYSITLIYFWLPSPELAKQRVRERVAQGGHNIPENDIERRYKRSLKNLIDLYLPLVDNAYIYDNSSRKPTEIASKESDIGLEIANNEIWKGIVNEKF